MEALEKMKRQNSVIYHLCNLMKSKYLSYEFYISLELKREKSSYHLKWLKTIREEDQ